jgi:hypothetical protein
MSRRMFHACLLALAIGVVLTLLSGCGGGDDEEEGTKGTNPPNCTAHPEQCR